jgi:UPF0271 protein
MPEIDINADMGEGFGAYDIGDDAAMLDIVTSANLACGFHAGDPAIMARRCAQAGARGVRIGAHPGYPDLAGFGRREMAMTPDALGAALAYQIGALQGVARQAGHAVTHVKVHGAMAHRVAQDAEAGEALIDAMRGAGRGLVLVVMAGTPLEGWADAAGLPLAREIFADRTYEGDGRLTPRDRPGALIRDPAQAATQVLAMLREGAVIARTGASLPVASIDTVCTHADSPGAVAIARAVRGALEQAGFAIRPFAAGPA